MSTAKFGWRFEKIATGISAILWVSDGGDVSEVQGFETVAQAAYFVALYFSLQAASRSDASTKLLEMLSSVQPGRKPS